MTAPPKPEPGAPCNGCGLCCIAETCPLGMILFRRRRGPCPGLVWAEGRYECGPAARPGLGGRLARRWIAAGTGCDST